MTNKIIDLLNDIDSWAEDCPYEEDIVDATNKIAEIVNCNNNKIKDLEKALGLACLQVCYNCEGRCDKCDLLDCCPSDHLEECKQYLFNKAKEKKNE